MKRDETKDPAIQRQAKIDGSRSYKSIRLIKKLMDDWYLDPIIGLIPYAGDAISSVMTLPYLYVSIFKLRSYSLTSAILYNLAVDWLLGLFPFAIGNIIDFFNRSYHQNYRLVTGFVEDNPVIVKEVRRKAIYTSVMFLLLCIAIYGMYLLVKILFVWISGLF